MMPEAAQLVSERERVWDEFDAFSRRSMEITGLKSKIGGHLGTIPTIAPLTKDKLPPHEIDAALAEIRQELTQIARLVREIDSHKAEMAKIRSRIMTIYVSGGVFIALLVIWILTWLAG